MADISTIIDKYKLDELIKEFPPEAVNDPFTSIMWKATAQSISEMVELTKTIELKKGA